MLFKDVEETFRFLGDEVDHGLIVLERNRGDLQTLFLVPLLFQDEDLLVELTLQHLIREINAQLLEAIDLHNLEAENVEDADEAATSGEERSDELGLIEYSKRGEEKEETS